jgi:hypothetical protein
MLFIGRAMAPSMGRALLLDVRRIARQRAARIALAVERYRLAHGGQLPESLAELAPTFIDALPNDPFTSKPMIYKKLDKGFTIYSVGEDQTDNGGTRLNKDKQPYEPGSDIPFTVQR